MNNILEVRALCKRYGAFRLNNVTFALPPGYIMGFIGPNGAGKTTTIKLVVHALSRDAGSVRHRTGFEGMAEAASIGKLPKGVLIEKISLDALYATLSVGRATVVLGRYIFALLLNVFCILFCLALGLAGLLAAKAFEFAAEAGETIAVVIALSALFIMIQSIQLPLYFRFGYAKAKFLSAAPFLAIMAGYFFILTLQDAGSSVSRFLSGVFGSAAAIPVLALAMLLFIFVSYRLSLAFFKKREF